MTDKKLDAMETLKSDNCKLRNAAMVYLNIDKNVPFEFLARATGLAISTVKTYVHYKFINLLGWAREIFAKTKNIVRKIASHGYYCYIMRIKTNRGYWTKIGQTTRDPQKRAEEILKKGCKTADYKNVDVMDVIECPDETAMNNMEDCLRIGMTTLCPESFLKNDRLMAWESNYVEQIKNNPFVKMGLEQFAIAA